MKKRKTRTTIEIHQVYAVRQAEDVVPVVCPECATEASFMVTPEEAAMMTGRSLRTIYARVEARTLHYGENADGSLFVCLRSVLEARNSELTLENAIIESVGHFRL